MCKKWDVVSYCFAGITSEAMGRYDGGNGYGNDDMGSLEDVD